MGIASSKNNSESLNWDKINTESMSTTLPNVARITKDAEQLISRLDVNEQILLEETESENDNLFTWLKTIGDDNDNDNNKKQKDTEASFSDTSAFISSDMYKYLMNNNEGNTTSTNMNQVGGNIQEDSSTSSTSSSPRKDKKSKKHNKYVESSSVMSGGDLSYISSSAHTEKENNYDSELEIQHYTSSPDSVKESSISVHNNRMLTSSINTSDINLISPDTN